MGQDLAFTLTWLKGASSQGTSSLPNACALQAGPRSARSGPGHLQDSP